MGKLQETVLYFGKEMGPRKVHLAILSGKNKKIDYS